MCVCVCVCVADRVLKKCKQTAATAVVNKYLKYSLSQRGPLGGREVLNLV